MLVGIIFLKINGGYLMTELDVAIKYIKFLEDFIIFRSNIINSNELYRMFLSRILSEK